MSNPGLYDPSFTALGLFDPAFDGIGLFDREWAVDATAAATTPEPVVRLQAVMRGSMWGLIGLLVRSVVW